MAKVPSQRKPRSIVLRPLVSGMISTEPGTPESKGLEVLGAPNSGSGRFAIVDAKPAMVVPDLPWAYQDDRLVLLVRDPRTLFAYWDCNPETIRRAKEQAPDGEPVLRLFALGGSEPRMVREVPIDLSAPSYYLYELEPNRDYRIELALRSPDGATRLVLKSNVAAVPSNTPSAWIEDRFASVPLDVPLPGAALFLAGRIVGDKKRQMHVRAYQLSLGQPATVEGAVEGTAGDAELSALGILEGFGGRSWSGTMLGKRPK